MSKLAKSLAAAAGNAGGEDDSIPNVEKVFSTYLYDGTGSNQIIDNGIDLDGYGGMVWLKNRNGNSGYHTEYDTEGGTGPGGGRIFGGTSLTSYRGSQSDGLQSFNSNGFTLGANLYENGTNATYGDEYSSWTFRKRERFFDMVTYTGDGTAYQDIPHSLGCEIGMAIVKSTSASGNWVVYHRSAPDDSNGNETQSVMINNSADLGGYGFFGEQVTQTDTKIRIRSGDSNLSGATYLIFLFAHDPNGANGDDGMIACGNYTGNGSADGPTINLGWEPQFIMFKCAERYTQWLMCDSMRGITADGKCNLLSPSAETPEGNFGASDTLHTTPTGFKLDQLNNDVNYNGEQHFYVAIRAPMMVEPKSGTEVFDVAAGRSGSSSTQLTNSDILTDFSLIKNVTSSGEYWATVSRLTGHYHLQTNSSTANGSGALANPAWDTMTGVKCAGSNGATNSTSGTMSDYSFKRAKGFFDVVAYTGDSTNRNVNHSLGVAPEMMLVKCRSAANQEWQVYHKTLTANNTMFLDQDLAEMTWSNWNNTEPTSEVFSVETSAAINISGSTYIACLFATLAGVSKVGNYTGTGVAGSGTSLNIDCGFSNGARFVLIKRTDDVGGWYFWDTARGIVTGNDSTLRLDQSAAENTSYDAVDPYSAGFTINATGQDINNLNAEYIFLAIA